MQHVGIFRPGDTVLGRYRVVRPLGEGGMGTVYLAEHVALEMPVAIKVIAAEPTSEKWQILRARFEREARTLGRLSSDYVCRVLDFGQLAGGAPFLVLEFLSGYPLGVVATREVLDRSELVDFIAEASAGVAEAHRAGLVHRDIKPSNLFVASTQGGRRRIKLIDFGLVRGSDTEATVTRGDGLLGTPEFMSPEQIDTPHDVDSRTDVWSLGAIRFWLMSHELPFDGPSRLELLASIVDEPPRMWLLEGKGVPPGLRDVIGQSLAKKPRDRPASVGALAMMLRPFAGPEGVRALEIAEATLRLPPMVGIERPIVDAMFAGSHGEPCEPPGAATLSVEYWKAGVGVERARPAPDPTHAREFMVPKIGKRSG